MADGAFFDSNVLLYVLSADRSKAERAEALLLAGGTISVQVLNEVANVARRKAGLAWDDIRELTTLIRRQCRVVPLTEASHDAGIDLVARYSLSLYDAMIVAAAAQAGCATLFSEDMQHGWQPTGGPIVINPFMPTAPAT